MKILVTGCAGFIGFHLSKKILDETKFDIHGIDNLNSYYDRKLKLDRLKILKSKKNFKFYNIDIRNNDKISSFFKKNKFTHIVHLAAQAGVRYSIENPATYVENNINGFFNIVNNAKIIKAKHLVFASTSSIYGDSKKFPNTESDDTSNPLSFYASTKKCNEVMAYSYSNIHKLACTGLRFFTVYGPYGRPDMSLFKFTKSILSSSKIDLYNSGKHVRDFTHVKDVVNAIYLILRKPSKQAIPFNTYNVASSNPQPLKVFLKCIEKNLGKKAKINNMKMQKGDVYKTHGSTKKLFKDTGFKPKITIQEGIKDFVLWFKEYYSL